MALPTTTDTIQLDSLTAVVDSPEWAWQEISTKVITDADDSDFYGEFTVVLNTAAARVLAPLLRQEWQCRGSEVVTLVPGREFGEWLDASDAPKESVYFEVWDAVADSVEFADIVAEADLVAEYRDR